MHSNSISLSRRKALQAGLAAVALPTMTNALAACSPEQAAATSEYAPLIDRISDLVIPETDTLGALGAGVPDYVRAVIGAFLTEDAQARFKSGLAVFDTLAREERAEHFLSAPKDLQRAILKRLDTANDHAPGKALWQQLRDMIIFGYYTSEAATRELAYEALPGRFSGDIPLDDIGRAWLVRGV